MGRAKIYLFLLLLAVSLFVMDCYSRRTTSGTNSASSVAPHLIHVSNPSAFGYYTLTGGYGFSTVANSIFHLGGNYNGGPMAQNSATGNFYFGTGSCGGCNDVFYLSGTFSGYQFGNFVNSVQALESGGSSQGVAVNAAAGIVYVADPNNQVVTYLNSGALTYRFGTAVNSIFAPPLPPLVPTYIAFDSGLNLVAVTETNTGSLYFLNGTSASAIPSSGGNTLPLTSGSTNCSAATNLGTIQVNSAGHIAYVLCSNTVILVKLAGIPTYLSGNIVSSTFNLAGMVLAAAGVYDSGDSTFVITGQSRVTSINGTTGAQNVSVDLSAYGCSSGIQTGGITYASDSGKIIVSDTANSLIYVLKAGDLSLSTGACSTSTFSTSIDVPGPTNLSYY
jgi:hypothetical protein